MELAYRTRSMGNPQGMPKVLFACHPDDFELAFELVADDILRHANCAIWYDPSPQTDPETQGAASEAGEGGHAFRGGFESDETGILNALDDMQLLVLAVTSRFLHEANLAKDALLPHALGRHIPVLPIMLETELEYKFNDACAPIQVVNRTITDSTATPYDEVLERFLNSVLVSDELAAKVRDAFDAYVFLSYRKKDRRHAQRLMHLIHENEQFRDIAIWYDEYLVPGEGFNEAIRDAFAKSSLFALAVTPHLLEPGNYVMDVEFPLARDRSQAEHDLEIVPVEMYEIPLNDPRTDRGELSEKYHGIPQIQDEHDATELDEALANALEHMARKENDGSSRHRFFIGLAYLNGIDVEMNHARALDLITQAATDEVPCIDATEKLVDMYLVGDGVEQSFDQSIHWQRLAVEQYRAAYADNHDPDEHFGFGTKCFRALMRLSDLLRDSGSVDTSIEAAEEALEFADKLKDEVGVREVSRDTAIIFNRLGSLHRTRRNYAKAEECYRRAQEIYERLAAEIGTTRARRDLSISYERIGDLKRRLKETDEAEELYDKALSIREALAQCESNVDSRMRRDLSSALTKRGNIRKDKGDLDGALEYYDRALDIDVELAEEHKSPQATDDWCVSLVKTGDVLKKLGALPEAESRFEAALAAYEELVDTTGARRYKQNRARCLGKLASVEKHEGNSSSAVKHYREAIDAFEELCGDGLGSDDDAHECAAAYLNYAQFASDREMAGKAAGIWAQLAARDVRYQRFLDAVRKRFDL